MATHTFGPFLLDTGSRRLMRGNEAIHLTPKAYELIRLLCERAPDAVAKSELHEKLWADTFVSDVTLASVVFELRTALGESARRPRFIRTVHGFGYAFDDSAVPSAGGKTAGCRLVIGGESMDLCPGEHLVGRSRGCSIRVESAKVSRVHARLVVVGSVATIEDTGSRNGTLVRGKKISGVVTIEDGDEVRFGSLRARFESIAESEATEATES